GSDRSAVQTLVGELTAGAVPKGDGALVPEDKGQDLGFYFSSDVRSSALVLATLLEVDPGNALVGPLVHGLLASRDGGRWNNTEDNFYSLTSLSTYAQKKKDAVVPVDVKLGGRSLFQGRLAARAMRRITVPLAKARGELSLAADDGQPVFYAAKLRFAPRPDALQPVARGFEVHRELVDPQPGQVVSRLKVGDTVKVRLTVVVPETRYRVALVDPLPAGLEVMQARLAARRGDGDDSYAGDWAWSFVEARDDRVQVFS